MTRKKGFTLVEVVVVIAVVSLLSAIIVPLVSRQIDEAKISRAQNECVVIASAILQFYRDVGIYPAHTGQTGGINGVLALVSGTAVDSDVPGTAIEYGFAATGNDNWYDGGGSGSAVSVFDAHLNVNLPGGMLATAIYPSTGEFRWRGPYLPPIGMDPWGRPYMCNISAAHSRTNTLCVVMSAGPNGVLDTTYTTARNGVAATTAGPTEDDIWAVVTSRP